MWIPRGHRCVVVLVVVGCSFDRSGVDYSQGPGDGPPGDGNGETIDAAPGDPPVGAVRFRKAITIPAANVAGALTDFPVYVSLVDGDLSAHATQSGADIHFVADDGTSALDHEIQAWDPDTGRLEAWVRLPALSSSASNVFYVQYGDFANAPAPDPAGVWQNGFVAVWHLEQQPDGSVGGIVDSLGDHDATSVNMNANGLIAGVVGGGLAFDGNNDQLTFSGGLSGASPHTISAWVDQRTADHNSALVVIGNGACTQARWFHTRFGEGPAAAGFYCDDWLDTGVDIQAAGWTLVHWTYDANDESRLYRDGVASAGPFEHDGAQSTVGAAGTIGNAPAAFGASMGLEGNLDEVRIADTARSAAWIATEHANQKSPAEFHDVGPEESLP